jgi:predicted GTPase
VDVRIGVTQTPRELELQLADDIDRDELRRRVEDAMGDDDRVLWITDRKGREVGVPSKRIAYVEIGATSDGRSFGFSS